MPYCKQCGAGYLTEWGHSCMQVVPSAKKHVIDIGPQLMVVCQMLIDSGDLTPMGQLLIKKVLTDQGMTVD